MGMRIAVSRHQENLPKLAEEWYFPGLKPNQKNFDN